MLLSSNLTFAPSQNSSNVVIQINNDGYSEITEEFAVDLISHNGNVIIQDGKRTLQVVITDQTGKCTRRVLSSVCVCVCVCECVCVCVCVRVCVCVCVCVCECVSV